MSLAEIPRPGSLAGLRRDNRERLLAALADEPMSQADLARTTGLSAAAVSGLVRDLVGSEEVIVRAGRANGRRGRLVERCVGPPRFGIGIDLGRTHVRVVLGSGLEQVVDEDVVDLPEGHTPSVTIRVIARMVHAACRRVGLSPVELAGVGMGVPGPVDMAAGTVTGGSILAAWGGLRLRDLLAEGLELRATIDNDANLGAIALDRHLGSAGGLVFVKVGSGIGAGVVIEGRPWRGQSGTVGEIGHLILDPGLAVVCRCGRRGCLETMSSTEAVRAALGAALGRTIDLEEVLGLVLAGDPVALTVVGEAGETLGRGLGWLATATNPARIVVGGPLARVGAPLLTALHRGFRQSVLPTVSPHTELSYSPFGERTEALGALVAGLDGVRVTART